MGGAYDLGTVLDLLFNSGIRHMHKLDRLIVNTLRLVTLNQKALELPFFKVVLVSVH